LVDILLAVFYHSLVMIPLWWWVPSDGKRAQFGWR